MLSKDQKELWGEYCMLSSMKGEDYSQRDIKYHTDKIEKILTDDQYEKLLKLRALPLVKSKLKTIYSTFEEKGIVLTTEDKKMIKKYFTAKKIIELRYNGDDEKMHSAKKMLKQSASKELKKLLTLLNSPKKAAYRGTYQW
jgi:hypothetical protein